MNPASASQGEKSTQICIFLNLNRFFKSIKILSISSPDAWDAKNDTGANLELESSK
jgi:hypothetical protein